MRRVTNLFFDLGGTLADLSGLVPAMKHEILIRHPDLGDEADRVAMSWVRKTAESTPTALGTAFRPGIVLTGDALVRALAKAGVKINVDAAIHLVRRACKAYLPRARLYEDASRSILLSLRSRIDGMGIVTDSDESLVRPLMKVLHLSDVFDFIIVSESMRTYKPDPRIYFAAMAEAHAEAAGSLFVSDSPVDLIGAASVGMGTVWIRRSETTDRSLPPQTIVLESLRSLDAVVLRSGT